MNNHDSRRIYLCLEKSDSLAKRLEICPNVHYLM